MCTKGLKEKNLKVKLFFKTRRTRVKTTTAGLRTKLISSNTFENKVNNKKNKTVMEIKFEYLIDLIFNC